MLVHAYVSIGTSYAKTIDAGSGFLSCGPRHRLHWDNQAAFLEGNCTRY